MLARAIAAAVILSGATHSAPATVILSDATRSEAESKDLPLTRPRGPSVTQAGWQQIGTTSVGNPVYLLTKSVSKDKNGIITATLRAVFLKGVKTPGGMVMSSKTVAMFDCAKQTVAVKENIYYFDEAKNRVYQRTAPKIPGFAATIRQTLADIALTHLCAAARSSS